ncbi:GntR family transcriptional regulator [Pseudaminobacter sp. 19-2017]|uniref:GntR family transcriptional regulator n=1 Tax=Pseudaminobacter soli (ex Zhang et al. 2022) TaxID=2831468 RepID=A0A942DZQ7_9HYPH|nr:GntR family transcriptional regulator [Pseudaminobacter soli]MBS3648503.1 GntR family transcriptional regulator [Pseudaminobacter soli]
MATDLTVEDAPLYQRIARRLEDMIGSGALKHGDRLPSERRIADELGASRMTARQALKSLERRGLVETRVGRGVFVARPLIEKESRTLHGFTAEMQRGGRMVSSVVLDAGIGAADREVARALDITEHTLVHRLVRVRLVDAEPLAVERTEIPVALAPSLLDKTDFSKDSLYRVLRDEYGLVPTEAEETVRADLADPAACSALRISAEAPVLRFTRRTFDGAGCPLEYVRSVYRADSFTMRVRLTLTKAQ